MLGLRRLGGLAALPNVFTAVGCGRLRRVPLLAGVIEGGLGVVEGGTGLLQGALQALHLVGQGPTPLAGLLLGLLRLVAVIAGPGETLPLQPLLRLQLPDARPVLLERLPTLLEGGLPGRERLPQLLKAGLGRLLVLGPRRGPLGVLRLLLLERVLALRKPVELHLREQQFQAPQLRLRLLVPLRLLGLPLQALHLRAHLVGQVADALQVRLRAVELPEGLAPAHLVACDAGRLLKHAPAVLGGAGHQFVDHLQLDHRVGVRRHPGVHEQVRDVFEAARGPVHQVLGRAVAEEAAADRDFGVLRGQHPVGVFDRQLHLRHAERAPVGRAVKDEVLHLLRPEHGGTLLADDPADGVDDVRLAAPVRPDDGGHAGVERERGLIRKALEALQFEFAEVHVPEGSSSKTNIDRTAGRRLVAVRRGTKGNCGGDWFKKRGRPPFYKRPTAPDCPSQRRLRADWALPRLLILLLIPPGALPRRRVFTGGPCLH